MEQILANLALIITPILFSGLIYFFHRTLNQLDELTKSQSTIHRDLAQIPELLLSVKGMQKDFDKMKGDLEIAMIAAKQVRILQDDYAILRRNQETIFKKIDKLTDDLSDVSRILFDFRKVNKV